MKIILQTMGYFDEKHDRNLQKILKEYGYSSILDIKARTDERIIKWLKDKTNSNSYDDVLYKSKGEGNAELYIEEVDTNRKWLIYRYDSAEDIVYLELENKELNKYKIVYE